MIGIDVDRDVDVIRKRQLFDDRSNILTEPTDRLGAKEDLVSVISFGSSDRGGDDRMEGHPPVEHLVYSAVNGFSGKFCAPLVFRADMDHQQMENWLTSAAQRSVA